MGVEGRVVTLFAVAAFWVALLLMVKAPGFESFGRGCFTLTPWPRPTPAGAASARAGFLSRRAGALCPVCTSAARKIKVALARARDGVHQGGLVSLPERGVARRTDCFRGAAGCPRWVGESLRRSRLYRIWLRAGEGAQLFPASLEEGSVICWNQSECRVYEAGGSALENMFTTHFDRRLESENRGTAA